MRVVILGGVWKGRVVASPREPGLRPTSQKVRAALFNILGPRVQAARVLDLYAGSGALGCEALSRGATAATFVDRAPECAVAIRRSLAALAPPPAVRVEVITADAVAAVRRLAKQGRVFELVFADPPYDGPWGKNILRALGAHGIIPPAGWLVLECHRGMPPPATVEAPLIPRRVARYGDTVLVFYQGMTEDR
ncbi:MAG: 16S rRNA (guanine(966)-N(2))-methyltransferase RsmD [Candidatus Omnitrophica bacterium]|nr:16S rRNA (guanine(966)-N(2))-methyltransferase RsmD [Candidatus Omnitrophota bacterium]